MSSKNTTALCDTLFDLMMAIKNCDDDAAYAKLVDQAEAILPLAGQYTDIKRVETENYNAVNKRAEILSKIAPEETVKSLTVKVLGHG